MSAIGPNNAATFASSALVGVVAITNPTNAQLSDNSYATAVLVGGQQTQYLKATNFALAVPVHSTIDGITVEIERNTSLLASVSDTTVKLYLPDNSLSATNQSAGAAWSTSDAYATFGGASDTWGQTLTPMQVNDLNFGVVISATAALAATASIDHVRMTVNYTPLSIPGGMMLGGRLAAGNGVSVNG